MKFSSIFFCLLMAAVTPAFVKGNHGKTNKKDNCNLDESNSLHGAAAFCLRQARKAAPSGHAKDVTSIKNEAYRSLLMGLTGYDINTKERSNIDKYLHRAAQLNGPVKNCCNAAVQSWFDHKDKHGAANSLFDRLNELTLQIAFNITDLDGTTEEKDHNDGSIEYWMKGSGLDQRLAAYHRPTGRLETLLNLANTDQAMGWLCAVLANNTQYKYAESHNGGKMNRDKLLAQVLHSLKLLKQAYGEGEPAHDQAKRRLSHAEKQNKSKKKKKRTNFPHFSKNGDITDVCRLGVRSFVNWEQGNYRATGYQIYQLYQAKTNYFNHLRSLDVTMDFGDEDGWHHALDLLGFATSNVFNQNDITTPYE